MSGDFAPPLRVEAASVRYRDQVAVRSVSLSVPRGEVLALAGPNGSGKSSLLRAIAGLEPLSEGTVHLLGRSLGSLSLRERARVVAWMPQEEAAGDNVPLVDYVRYGRFAHIPPLAPERAADVRAVAAALADADVTEFARRGVQELSGGERQRARLARVLAQETPILLLDEATAHLDVGHQLDLLVRIRRIARRDGRAVILALHDLNLAARFADRVAVLSHGQLVAEGAPAAILSPELLARVWGVVAEVRRDAATGLPYLIPQLPLGPDPVSVRPARRVRVHVVAGGGTGVPFLRRLVEEGYEVSAGALPLFDSDTEAAEALGVPVAVEIPFAPLGAEARARNRLLLATAKAIVVAPFPVGPSNLANLEDLGEFSARVPIFLVDPPKGTSLEFADGRATEVRAQLLREGAVPVADVPSLLAALAARLGSPRGPAANSPSQW
ncbi:MAG: ABC transporter ATP-binding protein [Thermoplasmata archaeon]